MQYGQMRIGGWIMKSPIHPVYVDIGALEKIIKHVPGLIPNRPIECMITLPGL